MGLHTLVTRGAIRGAEPAWIWVGCILPDVPWIGQRLIRALLLDLSPFDVRLYAIVQSSLLFCLVAAAGLAMLAPRPGRVLAILALGSLLHLLLDATQTKWANGVVLFAPVDWSVTNFGLYWPEDWPSLALTAWGAATAAWMLWRHPPGAGPPGPPVPPGPRRPRLRVAGTLALAAYLALPLAFLGPAAADDPHYVNTLRQTGDRANRCAAFDRAQVLARPGEQPVLATWTGEFLPIIGIVPPNETMLASVKGCFETNGELAIDLLHLHPAHRRDLLSYAGLGFVSIWLVFSGLASVRRRD